MSRPNYEKIYKVQVVSNGHGGYVYRITIPADWLQSVWWEDSDTVDLTYNEKQCIIRKTGFIEKKGVIRKVYFTKHDVLTINSKAYMILPKEVVRAMNIRPCDRVQWSYIERGMILTKIDKGGCRTW